MSEEVEEISKVVIGYRAGICRNSKDGAVLSHTYAMMEDGKLWPMCWLGWNRSDGGSFSIFRYPEGSQGDCMICRKNVMAGKPPLFKGHSHKTKWI